MNRNFFTSILIIALSLVSAAGFSQNTKYLSGIYTIGGNNANYSTIQRAITELTDQNTEVVGRVTFNIRPGVYTENLVLKPFKGASSKNFVVFKSQTNKASDVVIISSGGNTLYDNQVIRFEGATYITLQDITIENSRIITRSNDFASGIHFTYNRDTRRPSEYNTLNRCVIKVDSIFTIFNGNTIGVVTSDINNTSGTANCANYNTISNCTFYGGTFGIKLLGNTVTAPAKGNKINGNTFYKCYSGIDVDLNDIPVIANNKINCRDNENEAQFGIRVRRARNNFGIYNNVIRNYGTFGIFIYDVTGGSASTIYNNVIFGKVKDAYSRGIHVEFSRSINFFNNTISYPGPLGEFTAAFALEHSTSLPSSKISIKNNIFHTTGGAVALFISGSGTSIIDTSNYNDYFSATSGPLARINGSIVTGLTQIRLATGKDQQSKNVNPQFVSATDLHINSADLIRKGDYIPLVNIDFENQPRDPEMPDIGADEVIRSNVDLEVFGLDKNFVPKEGLNTLPVVIKNDGLLSLNGNVINISYKVGTGAFTSPEQFTLNSLALPYSKQTFNLATQWNIPSPGSYTLTIRVNPAVPNDLWAPNDEVVLNICVGLNGVYTIGGPAGPKNFADFATALGAFGCGVGGPTTFNIAAGTYATPFVIPVIKGVSATNTVTFQSASGNAADVVIANNTAAQALGNSHVIQLDGADYVILKNLTITNASSTAYAAGVQITNSADNITIEGCKINLPLSTNANEHKYGVIASFKTRTDSAAKAGNNLLVKNCTIVNGTVGVMYRGLPVNIDKSFGASVVECSIDSTFLNGIHLNNNNFKDVIGNKITMKSNSSIDGEAIRIVASKSDGRIERNKTFNAGSKGINLNTVEGTTRVIVANNMIGGGFRTTGNGAGILFNEVNKIQVLYNSVYYDKAPVTTPTSSSAFFLASGANVTLYNNIFYNPAGGYAYYIASTTSVRASNNNNYYTDANQASGLYAYWGFDRLTMASLKAGSNGLESNSLEVDPQFFSVSDLHTLNPALDGKGLVLADVKVDYDGQTRSPVNSDIGADEFILNAKDMALLDVSPSVFSTDPNTIKVKIYNLGSASLLNTPVSLQYSSNGTTWTTAEPFVSTGTVGSGVGLDTAYSSVEYSFNALFNAVPNSSYNFYVRIDPSNRVTGDAVTKNDTINKVICVGLKAGTYTVGGATPDYPDLTSAANAISCGITGPVTFNIRPGTYNERFTIRNPKNTSAINKIVFKSSTGKASDVIIKSDGVASNTTRNVIRLDAVKYVNFENLTILNQNNAVAGTAGIQIVNSSDNVTIRGCVIKMDSNSTTPNIFGIATSDSSGLTVDGRSASNLYIINNEIIGGSIGVILRGLNPIIRESGVVIDSNRIRLASQYGIFSTKVDVSSIDRNKILMRPAQLTGTGIAISLARNDIKITSNVVVNAPTIGLSLSDVLGLSGVLVANNMIGGGFRNGVDGVGVLLDKAQPVNLYYNSVNYTGTSVNGLGLKVNGESKAVRLLNNSIYNSGTGFAFLIEDQRSIDTSDNNNFAVKGAGFARYQTDDYLSIEEYRDVSLTDLNSVSVDPDYFTDTDLRSTNVFLDGAAVPIPGITTDIFGTARKTATLNDPEKPDIGAYEFKVLGDAVLEAIDSPLPPSSMTYPSSVPVTINVYNNGESKLSGLGVKYYVNTVEVASEVIVTPLLPKEATQFTFDHNYMPPATGTYHLTVEVYLPDDINTANNTKETDFFSTITDIADLALTTIVSPTPMIRDVPMPITVLVENVGTLPISDFTLTYSISGGTKGPMSNVETVTETIEPQQVLSYTFSDSLRCDQLPRFLTVTVANVQDDINVANDSQTLTLAVYSSCDQTGVGVKEELLKKGFIISDAYPNPGKNELNFGLLLAHQADVKIQLVSVLGNVIKEFNYEGMSEGVQMLNLDVNEIPNGIYFAAITVNGNSKIQRIVIQK